MNYLAHFYFAQHDDGLVVGALLGDFIKGTLQSATNHRALAHPLLPTNTLQGIQLHRHIDAQFDQLPLLENFKQRCPNGLRRYSGIFLDLYCDYQLSRQWQTISDRDFSDFESDIVYTLKQARNAAPKNAQRLINAFESHRLLSSYHDREVIEKILARIGNRLKGDSLNNAPLNETLAPLWELTETIESNFEQIMIDMQKNVDAFLTTATST